MTDAQPAGGIVRWSAGAAVPMFARPTSPVGLAWLVHLVLVVAVLVGGWFLNRYLYEWMGRVWDPLKPFFLPGLLLLAYALLWAAAWLWAQLAPEQPAVVYPDLDDAWAMALEALQRAGIGIGDTPVFLVIGELPAGFEPLFRALPRGVAVAGGTPSEAPVRVFANADAIYVTLSGATLLGVQEAGDIVDLTSAGGGLDAYHSGGLASIGFGQSIAAGAGMGSVGGGSVGGSLGSLGASMAGGGGLREIQRIIQRAKADGRELTDAEKERVRALSAQPDAGGGGGGSRKAAPVSVLQNPDLVGEAEARLTYLCQRVAASRWPLCPINGLILAVPVAALDADGRAVQWGSVARQDLSVIEATLKMRFPVFALVGGMELVPGAGSFFEPFSAEKGNQRLGKGFPLNPGGSPDEATTAVEAVSGWVLTGLLPYWALRYTRVGGANDTDENCGAVRFMDASARRGGPLGKLLREAVGGSRPATFGGCYLVVGSVRDPNEARFARDFFKKVEGSQAAVGWTDEAYAADAAYRRWAVFGHVALAVLAVVVVALAVYVLAVKQPFK